MDTENIQNQVKAELEGVLSAAQIEVIERKYLGKRGAVARRFELLKDLPQEQKKIEGQKINQLKQELARLFFEKKQVLNPKDKEEEERFDLTRPGNKVETGSLHPLTQAQRDGCLIFSSMGFEIVEGPEVETEWYNFDALNFPQDHPARDMQDTFWLRSNQKLSIINYQFSNKSKIQNPKFQKLLPRTHTSPVQIRHMEKNKPPLRIVVPGRVFRNEATDVSHEAQFYQLEGLMVDQNVSAANFKAIIQEFLSRFFGLKTTIRLRPGFFPFTEPSFEIDAKMPSGQWLELMGAGMVHPNVLQAAQIDAQKWRGFAFGVGLERLLMVKHKINDIRLFYQSDLRFLQQF